MAIVRVVFDWDNTRGECVGCGYPAGFTAGQEIYCAVCAANVAADGERITRIPYPSHLYDADPITDAGGYLSCGCHGSQREHSCKDQSVSEFNPADEI